MEGGGGVNGTIPSIVNRHSEPSDCLGHPATHCLHLNLRMLS